MCSRAKDGGVVGLVARRLVAQQSRAAHTTQSTQFVTRLFDNTQGEEARRLDLTQEAIRCGRGRQVGSGSVYVYQFLFVLAFAVVRSDSASSRASRSDQITCARRVSHGRTAHAHVTTSHDCNFKQTHICYTILPPISSTLASVSVLFTNHRYR